jgi:hypothetical protein
MEEMLQTGRLGADFFTHSYRISGQVDVRRQSLADLLNDRTTAFIELEDAYVSPLDRPADIVATYAASNLIKGNLTFVTVRHGEDVISRKDSYGSYLGSYLRKVFLTVPAFEIVGYLRLSGKVDLRRVLTVESNDFLAVLDGRIRASIRPDIGFTGGGTLVNKRHIGAFCLAEEE